MRPVQMIGFAGVWACSNQEDKLRLSLVCKPWRKLIAKPTTLWEAVSLNHAPACFRLRTTCILTLRCQGVRPVCELNMAVHAQIGTG